MSKVAEPRTVLALPIAAIGVPTGRVGFFDARHAEGLGADMKANGQHDPIHVKRNGNAAKVPWTLVAGLHRLRGAEVAGLTQVDALQVAAPGASAAELRRLELSENLDHRQRRPVELAAFMAARARLEEEADHPGRAGERPQDRAIRTRWDTSVTVTDVSHDANETISFASWRERTAVAMGCSLSKLEKYQRIYRAIVVELPDEAWRREEPRARELPQLLNFHPLGESFKAMDRLAGLNPTARLAAAQAILSRDDWKSIEDVLVTSGLEGGKGGKPAADAYEARIMSNWGRMPLPAQRAAAARLAAAMKPSVARAVADVLKERGLLS